jgi:hypothetical protein
LIATGIITAPLLKDLLREMRAAAADPDVLALSPRMSVVWARSPESGAQKVTSTLPISNF